jgi:hypothetical protein
MMNSPMLSIMQLVLWLVILSTFCYTWLASTEPSLSLKKDLREENGSVNITALAPIVTKKLDSKSLDAPVRRKVKKEGYSGLGDASVEPRIEEVVGDGTSNGLDILPGVATRDASSNLEQGCISQPSTGLEKQIKDYILQKACPISFFLFWTTTSGPNATANSTGFQTRHLRSVESAFVTHRTACVIFLSTLPLENRFMSALQDRGYNLLILDQFDVTSLLKYTPTEVWYYKVDEWRKGQYFFSHFTDLMRLAILYKFGGEPQQASGSLSEFSFAFLSATFLDLTVNRMPNAWSGLSAGIRMIASVERFVLSLLWRDSQDLPVRVSSESPHTCFEEFTVGVNRRLSKARGSELGAAANH